MCCCFSTSCHSLSKPDFTQVSLPGTCSKGRGMLNLLIGGSQDLQMISTRLLEEGAISPFTTKAGAASRRISCVWQVPDSDSRRLSTSSRAAYSAPMRQRCRAPDLEQLLCKSWSVQTNTWVPCRTHDFPENVAGRQMTYLGLASRKATHRQDQLPTRAQACSQSQKNPLEMRTRLQVRSVRFHGRIKVLVRGCS